MKETTRESIELYVDSGIRPGSFLQAVICNDLLKAVSTADKENLIDLKEITMYVAFQCPAACSGSKKKMDDWIKKGGRTAR